jgi:hypothetical protein
MLLNRVKHGTCRACAIGELRVTFLSVMAMGPVSGSSNKTVNAGVYP